MDHILCFATHSSIAIDTIKLWVWLSFGHTLTSKNVQSNLTQQVAVSGVSMHFNGNYMTQLKYMGSTISSHPSFSPKLDLMSSNEQIEVIH